MGELILYEYNFDKPELSEELLMHYGVKGMRWGVRRYQKYDGTRIKGGGKVINKSKQSKSAAKRAQRKADKEAQKKRIQKNKDEIAYMSKHPEKYSTKEINDKLNRINAETRLSEMNHKLNPTTSDKIKNIANNKVVKAIAVTALAAAVVTGVAMVGARYTKYGPSKREISKAGKNILVDFTSNPELRKQMAPGFKDYSKAFRKDYPVNLYNVGVKKIYDKMGIGEYFKKIVR